MRDRAASLTAFAGSSPRQSFVVIPLLTLCAEVLRGRRPRLRAEWLALWIGGYVLYRASGRYRMARGAGSVGFARAPDRLVTTGPYGWSRNPMYLGHLLSLAGLALATGSPVAVVGLLWQWRRLAERVEIDEERLERVFGDEYRDYAGRVPRWVPRTTP